MATSVTPKDWAIKLSSGEVRDSKDALGSNAPSEHLAHGEWGLYTVVELCVFFPKCMRNYDFARRFTRNGVQFQTLTNIINAHRMWSKHPVPAPTIRAKVMAAIRQYPEFEDWRRRGTAGEHWSDHDPNHDPTDLSLFDYLLQCERFPSAPGKLVTTILFRDLAVDVQHFPSDHDALDLTRCVQYAVQHADEDWYYPQDFQRLTEHLPGGPRLVRLEHYDASANARWCNWHKDDVEDEDWAPTDSDSGSDSDYSDEASNSSDEGGDGHQQIEAGSSSTAVRALSSVQPTTPIHRSNPFHRTPEIRSPKMPGMSLNPQPNRDQPSIGLPVSSSRNVPYLELADAGVLQPPHQSALSEAQEYQPSRELAYGGFSWSNTFPYQFDSRAQQPLSASNIWEGYSIDAMFAAEGLGDGDD